MQYPLLHELAHTLVRCDRQDDDPEFFTPRKSSSSSRSFSAPGRQNRGSGAGLNVGDRRYPRASARGARRCGGGRTRPLLRASGHERCATQATAVRQRGLAAVDAGAIAGRAGAAVAVGIIRDGLPGVISERRRCPPRRVHGQQRRGAEPLPERPGRHPGLRQPWPRHAPRRTPRAAQSDPVDRARLRRARVT